MLVIEQFPAIKTERLLLTLPLQACYLGYNLDSRSSARA